MWHMPWFQGTGGCHISRRYGGWFAVVCAEFSAYIRIREVGRTWHDASLEESFDHIALDPAAFTATHPGYPAVGEYTGCSKLVSDDRLLHDLSGHMPAEGHEGHDQR